MKLVAYSGSFGGIMKKIITLLTAALAMTGGFAACTKCSPKKDIVSSPKIIEITEIGKTLAPTICGKYETCNKDNSQFNKDQCLQEISAGIAENLKTAADLKVTQEILDGCQKAIRDSPCEALNSQTPPVGCEFLQ
jgi:hypothetical protein